MKNQFFPALLCSLFLLSQAQGYAKSYTGIDENGDRSVATHGKPSGIPKSSTFTKLEAADCVPGGIIYVDADAVGANDGSSWSNAYLKLQDALAVACPCIEPVQIWVASGTYYPDEGIAQTNNLRTSSFQLCNKAAIYGGFNGTETTLSQRNWVTNVTTLSGDIDQITGLTNNAYHVLIGSGTGNAAILDGFTVSDGNANGGGANNNGGGMVNLSGSPTLRNLRFTANNAGTLGGAIHNSLSSPLILNSTFISNTCPVVGGAINAEVNSHMTVIDCDFISNVGTINGGAVSISQSNPIFRDCRFIGNTSQEGGGIYAFRMVTTLTNCLFSGNRATNRGAGLHLTTDSNSKLLNCTIAGNNATGNGGGILLWNTPNLTLVNTIIYNNRAVNSNISPSASIFRDNATALFSNCLVANSGGSSSWNATIGTDSGNNIDVNPLFVFPVDPAIAPTATGDLRLTSFSFAKNVGSNSAYDVVGDPQNDLDLANNPRVFDYTNAGIIDLGPYEFQGPGGCPANPVLYVKSNATGNNDGTSWTNAFSKLQDALSTACTCSGITQVWVASGTYYPDEGSIQTNNLRTQSFTMCNNVAIYGGFIGTETALSQRNVVTNVTTLSGDIDQTPANNTGNAYHVVNASGTNNTAALDGFTITLGNANGTDPFNKGGGVYKENGAAKFHNNKFLSNSAVAGGGMFNLGGSIDIVKCIFENNNASAAASAAANNGAITGTYKGCSFINNTTVIDQGAIGCQGVTLTFDNCAFIGNRVTGATGGGGAFHAWASNITMKNTLFSGNKAGKGAAIFATFHTVIKLINVTGSGNWATTDGGFIFGETNSNFLIDNSIVWNNRAGTVTTSTSASVFHFGSTATISYSDVANSGGSSSWNSAIGINGGNNVEVNPQFVLPVDPATAPTTVGNVSLTGFSPAISVGSNAAYDVVGDPLNDTDLANNPRVFDYNLGCIIDMGSYEFQGQSACPDGPIVYVNAAAVGNNDGSTWTNAFTKLQDALFATACGGITEIWVAAGTYFPDEGIGQTNNLRTSSFQLKNNVAVYGGFDGTESILSERNWVTNVTTLSGDLDQFWNLTNNSYHVLIGSGTNNSAILDGFRVTDGAAYGGGANNNGGGMVNLSGSPTLRNLTFTNNYANTLGGAIHNNGSSPVILNCKFIANYCNVVGGAINAEASSHVTLIDCDFISNFGIINGGAIALSVSNPIIRDCRFIGNSSQEGGAIYAFRMVSTLTNCLFSGNRATNRGAALHLTTDANSTLVNCTLSGNMSLGNGGGILLWNTPNLTLVNTIIWNNIAAGLNTSTSASIFRDNANANFSYCLVANSGGSGGWQSAIGVDGGNNVDRDPLFILDVDALNAPTTEGDLHLMTGSPAINIGNNSANALLFDLDGNPRITDVVIDLGAFEHCTPVSWYADGDGDGYGDPAVLVSTCNDPPAGYVSDAGDCNDDDATIHPLATEICDGIDNDCDDLTDDADPDIIEQVTWYADGDGDLYGDPTISLAACSQPEGYVPNAEDCDDTNADIHPGAEICNEIDDDCDGIIDDGLSCEINDGDGDGIEDAEDNCPASENPGQEDSDCDGVGDVCDLCPGGNDSIDNNGDGFPDCNVLPDYEDIIPAWKCGNNKVYIAHGNSNDGCNGNCVNYNAAQAHLNHGDYLGPCDDSACNESFSIPNYSGQSEDATNDQMELFPNPTPDEITIRLHDLKGLSDLIITDQLGKILTQISLLEGQAEITISLLSLNAGNGLYFASIKHADGILVKHFVVTR